MIGNSFSYQWVLTVLEAGVFNYRYNFLIFYIYFMYFVEICTVDGK